MKRVLLICGKYATDAADSYLTNDLADEFSRQGFSVTVVGYGNSHLSKRGDHRDEYIIGLRSNIKYFKYFLVWERLLRILIRILACNRSFDLIVVTAPLSVMWPVSALMPFFRSPKKLVMIFDVYPSHQCQIRSIPAWAERFLRLVEITLLKPFTELTAMGPKNKTAISSYYKLHKSPIKIVNLWGPHRSLSNPVNQVGEPIRIIFGGQIIKGRRLDKLFEFLQIIRGRGIDLQLSIFSQGPGYDALKLQFSDCSWITFQDQLSREQYLTTLLQYHVGAIVTDEEVSLPTFPSKIIDYVGVGLYCFCLVERDSELYQVLGNCRRVHINSFDFSSGGIQEALKFFSAIKAEDTKREAIALNKLFSVRTAVSRIVA